VSEEVNYQATAPGMTVYYVELLRKGRTWTPESTAETERLQAAHLANNRRLVALGKLMLVGPCLDDGDLRGINVYRVESLEEARALADSDPAVQAGRLAYEIHPWMVPQGVVSETTADTLTAIDKAIGAHHE
jgi:uncharacterized protein